MKTKIIQWDRISNGDKFLDNSTVIGKHESYLDETYNIYWKSLFSHNSIVISSDHLLLCDISKVSKPVRDNILEQYSGYSIPTILDRHVYVDENNIDNITDDTKVIKESVEVVESDSIVVKDSKSIWLNAKTIYWLTNHNEKVYCNGKRIYAKYYGIKEVFCVMTDTHRFLANGLIHHNSVTLRNIIFHCLTHGEDISIALVDLKRTEFSRFKGPLSLDTELYVKED